MGLAKDQLFQAALEVQYERGLVYYDRCGSLMLKLQEALSPPRFECSIPAMQYGELRNDSERIVAQYGPRAYGLTQTWMPSPARFDQLAPVGWGTVAEALEVAQHVTRAGVRFWIIWPVDSLEAAIEIVAGSGLGPSGQLFGERTVRSFNAVLRDRAGDVRVALDAVAFSSVREGNIPKGLADVVPAYAVQLDLDHVHPSSVDVRVPRDDMKPFTLTRAQAKDFLRASWQRTREIATKVGDLLGGSHVR